MTKRTFCIGMGIGLMFFAPFSCADLSAQSEATPDTYQSKELVVTGKLDDRERRVDNFVSSVIDLRSDDPIPRFGDFTFCPEISGLSAARNAEIKERLIKVAVRANVKPAKPNCRINVLVIVSGDRRATIKMLRKKRSAFFVVPQSFKQVEVPIDAPFATVWHLDAIVDRSGVGIDYNADLGFYILQSPLPASRIISAVRPLVAAAVIVIDKNALVGLTSIQIADYAAMRLFTRTNIKMVEASGAPSILTIMGTPVGGEMPLSLTAYDFSVLKAIYTVQPYNHRVRQQKDVSRMVQSDLSGKDE